MFLLQVADCFHFVCDMFISLHNHNQNTKLVTITKTALRSFLYLESLFHPFPRVRSHLLDGQIQRKAPLRPTTRDLSQRLCSNLARLSCPATALIACAIPPPLPAPFPVDALDPAAGAAAVLLPAGAPPTAPALATSGSQHQNGLHNSHILTCDAATERPSYCIIAAAHQTSGSAGSARAGCPCRHLYSI